MPARISVMRVTAGLLPMLAVHPILGRTFTPEEDKQGQDRVVLLSEGLWRNRFRARRYALGKVIHLGDSPYSVVGVMPGNLQ